LTQQALTEDSSESEIMDGPFKIAVHSNKLSAYLTICHNGADEDISRDDLKEFLQKEGIVFGVDDDKLSDIIQQKRWDEPVQIASGQPSVHGENGRIEYYFETHKKCTPKICDDGSVDYHDLELVENVLPEQQLARAYLPGEGQPGMDVFGNPIPSIKGREAKLIGGKNTSFTDDSKTILQATAPGHVKLRHDGVVEVDTVYKVDHDVDYGTGDINVNGDLQISGDVKAGFKVVASGNIEIRGLVEDAEVTAGGDIIVKGGFVGQGRGLIRAGGKVILKFVHNQKVEAGTDIEVGSEAIQPDLIAGDSIYMNRGRGVLIGGSAKAGKSAIIDYVGNDQYVKTSIMVGDLEKRLDELANIDKELRQGEEKLARIKARLGKLGAIKRTNGLSPELDLVHRMLETLMMDIPCRMRKLEARKDEIKEEMRVIRSDAFIKVRSKIFPGVNFRVADTSRKFEREWEAGVFRIVKGELIGAYDSD
jgi:uncharacterized protein (DUF342 family)